MATTEFKVLRSDLERICGGNQRLLKAFENLFKPIQTEDAPNIEAIESAQITADTATTQSLMAIALIEAVSHLTELISTEPKPICTCTQYEDLSPRSEQSQQDIISPSNQLVEPMNLNLEVT